MLAEFSTSALIFDAYDGHSFVVADLAHEIHQTFLAPQGISFSVLPLQGYSKKEPAP